MDIRPCSHDNCDVYGLKYIYLRKANILRLEKNIKLSTIWTNTAVFCVTNIPVNYVKKVAITDVGLYLRALYKLYLQVIPTSHVWLWALIRLSEHCASEYYDT